MVAIVSSIVLLLLHFFVGMPQNAGNKSASSYPVSILWRSRVSYPDTPLRKGFILDVDEDTDAKGDFREDHFVLEVLTNERDPKRIARMTFVSTYGKFDLALADVTGDGVEEFVLVTGEGRGTNARFETLAILKREGSTFKAILKVPVSAPCGVSCRWEYERHFDDIKGDGALGLRLVRKITGTVDTNDHRLIPKDEQREYAYSASEGKMLQLK